MKTITLEVVSPPRCGSTLTYSFFKKCVAGKNNKFFNIDSNVNKSHPPFEPCHIELHNFDFNKFYIFCIRHPFSQLASLLIYDQHGESFNSEECFTERYVFNKLYESIRDYLWCYDFIKNNTNNINVFKYEQFHTDVNFFFNWTNDVFGFEYTEEEKSNFDKKFSSNNIKNLYKLKKQDDDFESYSDHHISFHKGSNEENIKFIPYKFRSRINREYTEVYKLFNYNPVCLQGIPFEKNYLYVS